ncbi:hypothetical protein [Treponema denticola]|uniref:hypothetical protein n=1 Tax=Treponema denticola TaxID=158 RepID=UPI0002B5E6E5|nr:hypothetical protein [Treponema denticola]EMB26327.1 hypothetical protein HMPREF9724_00304 [Treponema denticola SP37]EPF33937.1 hypothetical protein HMPREF9734_01503 [Treponema denticola SP44]EPF39353.1 hypothetical protein HMPREF9731_01154 [Treponema denticola SP23]
MKKEYSIKLKFCRNDNEPDNTLFGTDSAYMSPSAYKEIFGKTLAGTNRENRFIKISHNNNSIYRILRGVPHNILSKDIIYMDSDGKNILNNYSDSDDKNDKIELEIIPVSWFSFYWHTSNIMARISFKTGVYSIILGLISIGLSVWQIFFK